MSTTTAVESWSEEEVARLRAGPDATEEADAEPSLSADDLFHVLQNSRRRAVIRYLRGWEGVVQIRDVAEQVAAWENNTTIGQFTSDERQRVYVTLYQNHLEKLADADVIEYNKSRGVIKPRPLLEDVAAYVDMGSLEATDEDEASDEADGWNQWYMGAGIVAVVSGLLFIGTALGFLTSFTEGVLILIMFTGIVLAKFILDERIV